MFGIQCVARHSARISFPKVRGDSPAMFAKRFAVLNISLPGCAIPFVRLQPLNRRTGSVHPRDDPHGQGPFAGCAERRLYAPFVSGLARLTAIRVACPSGGTRERRLCACAQND